MLIRKGGERSTPDRPDTLLAQHPESRGDRPGELMSLPDCFDRSSFWTPELIAQSGWLEHAPFAFWLIGAQRPRTLVELGTHYGYSYFAFCQAVAAHQTATRCIAVDTWQGDEHAGFYGEEVFTAVAAHNERRYAAFSTLIRATFDEAISQVADGSIDLLHIDGRHFEEDVRHDFQAWRPKLSDRSIVLLHDTNVHERGFGVHRFFAELARDHVTFEFLHGHGLGVVRSGADASPGISALFAAASDGPALATLREAYSTLGARLTARYELDRAKERGAALEKSILELTTDRKQLRSSLQQQTRTEQALREDLGDVTEQFELLRASDADLRAERDRLAAAVANFQAERDRATAAQRREVGRHAETAASGTVLPPDDRQRWRRVRARMKRGAFRVLSRLPLGWPNPLFDPRWYLATYPDVRTSRLPSQHHYRRHGAKEGRNPNPYFDTDWYLREYADVAASGMDPLDHFFRFGARERRMPSPYFDTAWYLDQNPDVVASGMHPLLHYIRHGSQEGRSPRPTEGGRFDGASSTLSTLPLPGAADGQSHVGSLRRDFSEELASARLREFLASEQRLVFPKHDHPVASIVIPAYGRAHLTFLALESLLATATEAAFELIVVDNASTDETPRLLRRLTNVRVLTNDVNLGFGGGCTLGASVAVSESLLFLNSDTIVSPGWIASLLDTLQRFPDAAAVGSRLIHLDGRLQEAGGVLWRDASVSAFGRGGEPGAPEVSFVRPVDFCSAASLLVRRDVFVSLGGFDERYHPAYYEDVDLCLAIWESGRSVMYQPRSAVFHAEHGSTNPQDAITLQLRNREAFAAKWPEALAKRVDPDRRAAWRARDRREGWRVLVIDDRVPTSEMGSGFPRTASMLDLLSDLGTVLTYLPTVGRASGESAASVLEQNGVEVLRGGGNAERELRERAGLYDAAVVSRPHNSRFIQAIHDLNPAAGVVYDAEALFSLRDVRHARAVGRPVAAGQADVMIDRELALAADADAILAVTEAEAEHFGMRYPHLPVHVWATATQARRAVPGFADRAGLLFVGYLATAPNADAMTWFLEEILGTIRSDLDADITIVGAGASKGLMALADRHGNAVTFTGPVDDLTPIYDSSRVFIAPHRFAAGIPLKVVHAMANGVPCVISTLLCDQLGIRGGTEALVADTPAGIAEATARLYRHESVWSDLRDAAFRFVEDRFSPANGKDVLRSCLESAMQARMETSASRG